MNLLVCEEFGRTYSSARACSVVTNHLAEEVVVECKKR